MQQIFISLPEPEFETLIQRAVKNVLSSIEAKPQPKDAAPELLTRAKTAKYLGVSLPTLNDWTKRNIIKGYRISGRVRYKLPDIENALKEISTIKYKRGA